MLDCIKKDLFRYTGTDGVKKLVNQIKKDKGFEYLVSWRVLNNIKNPVLKLWAKYRIHKISRMSGIEIPLSVKLGNGIMLLHPYNITINSKAVLGNNITILKGATVGNTKGTYGGAPTIGDNVYIGLNSVVVGNIKVGNDVLIGANSFVNFDVPDHSVVVGNPGVIHPKEFATKYYIDNCI